VYGLRDIYADSSRVSVGGVNSGSLTRTRIESRAAWSGGPAAVTLTMPAKLIGASGTRLGPGIRHRF